MNSFSPRLLSLLVASSFLVSGSVIAADSAVPKVSTMSMAGVAGVYGSFSAPLKGTPSAGMPSGPLTGNGDMGLVIGGNPDQLKFYISKSDFFGVIRGGIMPVGSLVLSIPELKGASYQAEQHIDTATIDGKFKADDAELSLVTWVAAPDNRAILELHNTGNKPLTVTSQLLDSWASSGNDATYGTAGPGTTSLKVSPDSVEWVVGNRLHGVKPMDKRGPAEKPGAFQGQIADVQIFNKAISPSADVDKSQIPVLHWTPTLRAQLVGSKVTLNPSGEHGGTAEFAGDDASALSLGFAKMPQEQFTVSAWVQATSVSDQNFIFSALSDAYHPRSYPFKRGVSLGIIGGKLSATSNQVTVAAPDAFPLNKWVHVALTYDGATMAIYEDSKQLASTDKFPTADDVMGWNQEAIHFGDKKVPFNGCGPDGLFIQRVIGVPAQETAKSLGFTIPAGGKAIVILAVQTNRNTPEYLTVAQNAVKQSDEASLAALYKEHLAWWMSFYSRSYVQIPDKKIQDYWYGSLYLLACCSRPECPPPGLWGNFTTQRQVGWQGDYTLDYNIEAPFWAAYATNHFGIADNYEGVLLDYMPRGRAIAKHYKFQGLYYYTHLIPGPGWDDDPSTFLGQKSGILFGVVNCAMRWRYTLDPQYAKKVYPLMKGVAEFWSNYLVLQNGRYVDTEDGAVEGAKSDTNTATTLAFLRLVYPALIDMSQVLKVDEDLRPKWTDILAKLSPLPIVPAESVDQIRKRGTQTLKDILGDEMVRGKMVIRDTEIGTGFPDPMVLKTDTKVTSSSPGMNSLQVVYPGWAIGLESSDQEKQAAFNTATFDAQWFDFNNDCTFYPSAASVGIDPESILQHIDTLIQNHGGPNFVLAAGGGGVENFSIIPTTLAAMFVQSYQKNIHVFPNWPKNQDASFGGLTACGGFLISSKMEQGKIAYVKVESTAGAECRIANPWPTGKVQAKSSTGKPISADGPVLTFPTQAGETIELGNH